jgi:hypothetical protein
MLTIGLLVEAGILCLPFEDVDKFDWALVYPELANGNCRTKPKKLKLLQAQGYLSQKLTQC